MTSKSFHILLCCTGSVACLKIPLLIPALKEKFAGCGIKVVLTENSEHFLNLEELSKEATIIKDKEEWNVWKKPGDRVLHIDLCNWADLVLFAPLDANTLAKLANGLCDNLVSCIARAWDFNARPVVFCPSMNTQMWLHPVTAPQVETLKKWGCKFVSPVVKVLACGAEGIGAMAEIEEIVEAVSQNAPK
ncbi:phosphopantothenoylcysteine decarboxylase-like [Styela clava]|uniref:phosphopantothenoylcysteine decarboxylase-like n=1 Tax=Styela clava TaxID=7725 RepID=UPI00193A4BD9|nr:phosphopantothenoylcysteine decarboxylase-like [Styela clava]